MKRKYLNKKSWPRIASSICLVINNFDARFNGYASAIFIKKVHTPLMGKIPNHETALANNNYTWIQRLPLNTHHAITVMFDENENIVQWYIDITKQNSIDTNKEPFFDDLYLDVVIFPNGDTYLLDEDELEDALKSGDISKEDFNLAYLEANNILNGLAKDVAALSKMSIEDLKFFKGTVGKFV